MAKKNEDTEVKATATKKTTKSTAKTSTKTTAKTSKADKPAKNKTEAKEKEKKAVITNITPEEKVNSACQQMLSSVIAWSMDALMFQNIVTLSQKMNISLQ